MGEMIVSAGVVVVRRENRTWKFLLLRAYRNWDFPKGLPEPGEDLFETAQREVREETGIGDLEYSWGREYRETAPYLEGRKVARYYLGETRQAEVVFSINPELGHPEHQEYRWLSLTEARKLVPERLRPIIDWAWGLMKEDRP